MQAPRPTKALESDFETLVKCIVIMSSQLSLGNQAQDAIATALSGGQILEPFPLTVVNDA